MMFEISRTGTWSMLRLKQMSKHYRKQTAKKHEPTSLNPPNGFPMVKRVTCREVSFGIVMLKSSNGQTAAMSVFSHVLHWIAGPAHCMRTAWLNQNVPLSPVFWGHQTPRVFLTCHVRQADKPAGSSKRSIRLKMKIPKSWVKTVHHDMIIP